MYIYRYTRSQLFPLIIEKKDSSKRSDKVNECIVNVALCCTCT